MKIAYVCADFGIPVFGTKGASVHVRELTSALESLRHDVLILTPRGEDGVQADFQAAVEHVGLEPAEEALHDLLVADGAAGRTIAREVRALLYGGTLRRRGLEVLREFRPDVVIERYSLLGRAGIDLARALGVPFVLEVNAPLVDEQAKHRGLAFVETACALERELLCAADQVVTVSTGLERWLVEVGVEPSRIAVLPNAVDAERFDLGSGQRSAVRAELGVSDQKLVGFVGSLRPWHDLTALVEAVAALDGPGRRIRLLVIGDGPRRGEVAESALQFGVDTIFTGAIPHEQVPAHLAAVDLAVVPYAHTDSFYFSPLKLVEYLAAGVPVVAADIGDVPHCVRPGETGWLYPPGDVEALAEAIGLALEDELSARRMARQGREHVRAEHSWHANAERIVELAHEELRSRSE